jgi:hypothetical protein
MNLKFRLLETPLLKGDNENNWFGFEKVEIIQFNYDGKGGVIAILDDELKTIDVTEVEFLVNSGWYMSNVCEEKLVTQKSKC